MKKRAVIFALAGIVLLSLAFLAGHYFWPETDAEYRGTVVVKEEIPLSDSLFIQGLEMNDKELICATGRYGSSMIGILNEGKFNAKKNLPSDEFGEGITVTEDELFQLTWREGLCYVRDPQTFEVIRMHNYEGEGWGICYDGTNLIQSDGTAKLKYRAPGTFEVISEHTVVDRDGNPVVKLNELEFANGHIYANIWQTKDVVKIDPKTFKVVKVYTTDFPADISHENSNATLNGIAHIKGNRFYLTGKLWNAYYKVELKD